MKKGKRNESASTYILEKEHVVTPVKSRRVAVVRYYANLLIVTGHSSRDYWYEVQFCI
jgi:hypothetical protein